jgi:prepilin-type N-terminal cleavage/methylation domain-containing protein
MMRTRTPFIARPLRRGFSLIELVIVLVIMGVVAAMTIPRLNLSSNRVEAIAQQVRSVFQTSQRTSLTRQFDVIISFDTVHSELRIGEDKDLSGTIDATEIRIWRPTGQNEGNIFAIPPKRLDGSPGTSAIVGSSLKTVDTYPSITFHRDGSASSDAEIYMSNSSRGDVQYRLVTLTRSTGRTDMYRYSGKGSTGTWQLVR